MGQSDDAFLDELGLILITNVRGQTDLTLLDRTIVHDIEKVVHASCDLIFA